MTSILCVIPARGGSKRVPRKNEKILGGKPLVAWSINTALASKCAGRTVVSTDDACIASKAKEFGAEVPFMRLDSYATDKANVIDAVLEVIEFYEGKTQYFDAVLLLQPTSPFRTECSIQQAVTLFNQGNGESVVSVSPSHTHPYWCKKIENGVLFPFDTICNGSSLRSQDLPDAYELNGSIYLASVETLRKNKSFYSTNTQALLIESKEEALDIDTPFDWLLAETIVGKGLEGT